MVKTYLYTFFFFNDPATTEIYTLSLHDALPISPAGSTATPAAASRVSTSVAENRSASSGHTASTPSWARRCDSSVPDRKSTRLNSSHANISYAVFCLKKKTNNNAYIL